MEKTEPPLEYGFLQRSLDALGNRLGSLEGAVARLEEGVETVTVAIFGRFDEKSVKRKPGLYDQMEGLKYAFWVGAIATSVIALHTIGVPTEVVWKLISTFFTHT